MWHSAETVSRLVLGIRRSQKFFFPAFPSPGLGLGGPITTYPPTYPILPEARVIPKLSPAAKNLIPLFSFSEEAQRLYAVLSCITSLPSRCQSFFRPLAEVLSSGVWWGGWWVYFFVSPKLSFSDGVTTCLRNPLFPAIGPFPRTVLLPTRLLQTSPTTLALFLFNRKPDPFSPPSCQEPHPQPPNPTPTKTHFFDPHAFSAVKRVPNWNDDETSLAIRLSAIP